MMLICCHFNTVQGSNVFYAALTATGHMEFSPVTYGESELFYSPTSTHFALQWALIFSPLYYFSRNTRVISMLLGFGDLRNIHCESSKCYDTQKPANLPCDVSYRSPAEGRTYLRIEGLRCRRNAKTRLSKCQTHRIRRCHGNVRGFAQQ